MIIKSTQNENLYINMAKKNTEDGKASSAAKNKKSNVIYAGNLNADTDTLGLKKQLAQKQAMKAIMNQSKTDNKSEDKVAALLDKKQEFATDADLASEQIKNLRSMRDVLKESYGVTDDSTEQKNLDLLEKSIYGSEDLTEDEQQQLEKMGPLTDYQQTALYYDSMEKIWQQRVDNAANGISSINESITSIGLEKLKSHPMTDAQKQAAQILEDASQAVISTIMQQTKEAEDDKLEKNEEDVEKQQEAKKEEDAKKEKAAQNDQAAQKDQGTQNNQAAQNTSSTAGNSASNTVDASGALANQQKMLNDVKDFAKKQQILEDDIKGIMVDEQA
jgi:hypothetical protein